MATDKPTLICIMNHEMLPVSFGEIQGGAEDGMKVMMVTIPNPVGKSVTVAFPKPVATKFTEWIKDFEKFIEEDGNEDLVPGPVHGSPPK